MTIAIGDSCKPFFTAVVSVVLGCLLIAGCSKSEDSSASVEKKISPIPVAETERAKIACDMYVARVCKCAETYPKLEHSCLLAKGIPQALQMNLDAASARGLTILQQKAMKAAARKISAGCFRKEAKLSLEECPRVPN